MPKTNKKAYLCWLFGGLFGLHNFYLGRDKHGFVWLTTLGGFFIGTFGDLFKIKEYVNEANLEQSFADALIKKQAKLKSPAFKTWRFIGSILIGSFIGYVSRNAFPLSTEELAEEHWFAKYLRFLSPFLVGLFVKLFNTEGPFACSLKWPLLGAYLAYLIDLVRGSYSNYSCAILATLFLNWNIEWDRGFILFKYYQKTNKFRLKYVTFFLGFLLVMSIYSLFILNNLEYEVDGKKVTIKESVEKFFSSKEMQQLKETGQMLWNFYKAHGFKKLYSHLFYGGDAEAIAEAYRTIEMKESSSQEEINQTCKSLSRKWHPDKFKNAEQKQEAEKKFMEIQQACNAVSEDRRNKLKQNQKSEI